MRKTWTPEQRLAILKAQDYRCAHASTCLVPCLRNRPFEIDHRVALCFGGRDALDNLQALCCECHAVKTERERHDLADVFKLRRIRSIAEKVRACLDSAALPSSAKIADGDEASIVAESTGLSEETNVEHHNETDGSNTEPSKSETRKRKRHHERGEMPTRATPISTHPDYERVMARIRQKGEFDRVCENPDQFTTILAEQLRYYKHVTPGRGADHYFYADGFEGEDLRGVEKVARAFLGRAGLPTDHLLRHTQMKE